MEIRDFWSDIHSVFEGRSEQIKEIDLMNLKAGSMAQCLEYLLSHSKDCNCRFTIVGTDTEVALPSLNAVINYVLQEQVSVIMWLSLPALPMLSIYIDFANVISFGFVRGAWNAMAVLAFFDLMYELNQMSPGSEVLPNEHSFNQEERQQLLAFWQDYNHATP